MEQLTTDQIQHEEVTQLLVAILEELREANRRERERDTRKEAEASAARRRYDGL